MAIRTLLICLTAFLFTGCCHKKPTREPWFGQTLPMDQVIERVNANNQLIPTLWATTDLEISVTDEKGRKSTYSGSGSLLYRRPGELFLEGKHVLGTPLFEMGSNADDYWLIIPELQRAWWGHHRNVGKSCVQELPIRPDLLVEMLGVSTTNINLLEQPVPVMRFNHDEWAYMFVWQEKLPWRWIATKEIWYDLETLSPRKVVLFDALGRTILKADLSNPKPIEVPELPKERWPKMATEYKISFPASKAGLNLKISDVALTHRTRKNMIMPNNGSFATPDDWGDGIKVIQVDKGCKD